MQSTPPPIADSLAEARVFRRLSADHAVWLLTGGLVAMIGAVFGFMLALHRDVNPVQLQVMTTLPVMAGLALIGRAWQARGKLRSVTIDAVGITLETRAGSEQFPWTQIAWNSEGIQPMSSVPRCTLYGTAGQALAHIPAVVEGFDELIVLINRQIKSQPTDNAEHVRRVRLRRQSLLVVGFGLVMVLVLSFLVWSELDGRRRERLLASEPVEGTATIERKFTAPDGRTRRVEYRVDAKKKDGSQPDLINAELDPFVWELTQEGSKVDVNFARSDPDISRLALGQKADGPRLGWLEKIVIFGIGGVGTIFFLVFGTLNGFGIDLVIDSETKRLRIARSVAK